MSTEKFKYIYLLGIGGIGMSALARYFFAAGKVVAGYDKTPTSLTSMMENDGISIHFNDDVNLIPREILDAPREDVLVIYTPAVPANHAELNWFKENNYTLEKRAAVLGWITKDKFCIAVAGTHGKTSTTTITAHLLTNAGKKCTAFMGGMSINYNTNLLLNPESDTIIVEADEYDRSFLQLVPNIAIVTAMDADHLDIYGSAGEVTKAYQDFARKLVKNGSLIARSGLDIETKDDQEKLNYSADGEGDFVARNIRVQKGMFVYDMHTPQGIIEGIHYHIPGRHNIENSIAASAAALKFGLSKEEVKSGLESYRGVHRRMEFHIRREDVVFVDDYAHHPAELRACISALKELYPGKKITGVFQPHLYTRTRDFMEDFRDSLRLLDECLLLEIYAAREEPLEGITSEKLAEGLTNTRVIGKDNLIEEIIKSDPEVLVTMGAGDISQMVEPIKKGLTV